MRIVEAFDVFEHCGFRFGLGLEVMSVRQFALQTGEETKKLSAIALSKQSPIDPIEGRTPSASQRLPRAIEVYWVNSFGRCNTSTIEVAKMSGKRRSDLSGRAKSYSPDRPTVGLRAKRQKFWVAIAAGFSSEVAPRVRGQTG
jgi:hypothetical protein